MTTNIETNSKLFALGNLLITPGAKTEFADSGDNPVCFLRRHQKGDWGDLCQEDKNENDLSISAGFRIFSAYLLANGQKIWIITEANRESTTILLPNEY